MELYKTVRGEASAPQTIERSKFIAHIRPVGSREEAEEFIASIRAQYRDATHNVPAMVLGDKAQIQWASDDGEPQGTSGAPMVQLFVGEGLTNLVIVVTRYFGGIKLGTGGLVRAYSSSAKMAVEAAGICSVCSVCRLSVRIEYTFLDRIMKLAGEDLSRPESFVIADTGYGEKVTLQLLCQEEDEEKVRAMLANVSSGTAQIIESTRELQKV
ncbi:MAG: YigZ family protein [Firmicutes bacterium]|nr:YigZ family protein [Bacillota bacterium]